MPPITADLVKESLDYAFLALENLRYFSRGLIVLKNPANSKSLVIIFRLPDNISDTKRRISNARSIGNAIKFLMIDGNGPRRSFSWNRGIMVDGRSGMV